MADVADDALVALADSGPEYDPFDRGFLLANHGPMVVDALLAMGREDEGSSLGWNAICRV